MCFHSRISYSDFIRTFTHLELVHLDSETARDEPSLRHKTPWNSRAFQGAWQKGVTAGGCRNNIDTFHINPQLHLILSEMEEVVISLNQHSVIEPKVIGFTAYPVTKNGVDSIGKSFYKKHKSLVNSQYTNNRQNFIPVFQVCERVPLEQGGYVILPTTFEPGQESSFTLRVFSSKPIKLRMIDVAPCLIQPALLQAKGSLEAKRTGRLKFCDFKDLMVSLKFWQSAFKSHTKERTGILKAERLRDALEDVGFRLSTEVVSTLVLRYMRKDGTLRFGDFVSAVLRLSMAFNIFEKKDPLQNGNIRMTMSEWLKASILC
ncbi:Calpain small subunit 2 [Armadillidium nasatum]|uniref:Calpain small subunit 2 n=1 Tax=Armadillidium nasatum TaxID=96803 RepID=A0A5N5SQ53_9CRUS|nr:Calpain small subunit 2 [Armadillidium nasatum]